MKIFLDTADPEAVRRACVTGLLDGVTTNPSHIAKTGQSFDAVVKEICSSGLGHVSVEAMGESTEELVRDAEKMAAVASSIVVKIPMTPQGMTAVSLLEKEKKIRTNVTMVFSPTQAFLAMKAGASFVSIVLSRLENVGHESDSLIHDTVVIQQQYGFSSQIIAGSVKTQPTLLACLRAGVDIATIPEALFFQLFQHPLTEAGLEQFQKDWLRVPK
jgi:transaldolase